MFEDGVPNSTDKNQISAEVSSEVERAVAQQTSLRTYSELGTETESYAVQFSLLKLGIPAVIRQFSAELTDAISRDLIAKESSRDEWVICSPPSTIEHAAGLMAEQISKSLQVPLLELEKKRAFGNYSTITTTADRESVVAFTMYILNPKRVKGKKIIIIDDLVASGAVLRESARALLDAGACEVIIFTLLKLDSPDFSLEGKLNDMAATDKLDVLVEALNQGCVITSATLKLLLRMSNHFPDTFRSVAHRIDQKTKKNLVVAAIRYHQKTYEKTALYEALDYTNFTNILREGV
ncbi:TPA: phosphoribosyltransferase [Candidatus Woesearchaeota archaeon]|nr:phosphoribosyltransferase [Candidatus Woesearchaeota archaeon]